MLAEPPVCPERQRLQDKLGQRLREREEERRKADELAAAEAAEDGDKKKKKKKKKKKDEPQPPKPLHPPPIGRGKEVWAKWTVGGRTYALDALEAEAEADADESRRVAERETRQSAFYWQ